MPAEAIHLSAFADTLAQADPLVRSAVRTPRLLGAARLGAVFVDTAYFERFPQAVVRYLAKRPPVLSRWGNLLHTRAPIALGREFAESGAFMMRESATREAGEYMLALALGYISHAAADTSMHPLVNRLARERAAALNDAESRQHNEVEKLQSVLFHEMRFGFDFMGTSTLRDHITVDAREIVEASAVSDAVLHAMANALGEAPGLGTVRSWAWGYGAFVRLVSAPVGKTMARADEKARERASVFDDVGFLERFAEVVARSQRWVRTLADYARDGAFDASARAELAREMPEQSLDTV